jgi:hypothetical protein
VKPSALRLSLLLAALSALGGCDLLGIESTQAIAARREAEGKAVGAACRHAGRAIEDCYTMNRKADKAAVFAGWRDMNDYMRENQIEAVRPQLSAQAGTAADDDGAAGHAAAAAKPAPAPAAAAAKPARTQTQAARGS